MAGLLCWHCFYISGSVALSDARAERDSSQSNCMLTLHSKPCESTKVVHATVETACGGREVAEKVLT